MIAFNLLLHTCSLSVRHLEGSLLQTASFKDDHSLLTSIDIVVFFVNSMYIIQKIEINI